MKNKEGMIMSIEEELRNTVTKLLNDLGLSPTNREWQAIWELNERKINLVYCLSYFENIRERFRQYKRSINKEHDYYDWTQSITRAIEYFESEIAEIDRFINDCKAVVEVKRFLEQKDKGNIIEFGKH